MAISEDNLNLGEHFELIQKFLDHPILKEVLKNMHDKIKEEQSKMGKVNILIAGKTGVGKSTLVNAVFGKTVATTGTGRPVTDEIRCTSPRASAVVAALADPAVRRRFKDVGQDIWPVAQQTPEALAALQKSDNVVADHQGRRHQNGVNGPKRGRPQHQAMFGEPLHSQPPD